MIGLEFLQKVGGILQQTLSSEEIYTTIFDILDGVIEYDSATLFICDPESGVLKEAETRGPKIVDLASSVAFDHGAGLSGWVASRQAPVILSTVSESNNARSFRSMVAVPLWLGDKLCGVLNLGHKQAGFYSQENQAEFEELGLHLSLIVERLRLRSELHEKNLLLENLLKELRETQSELVEKERMAAIGEVVVKLKHEINNPLSIIISFTDLLAMRCEKDNPEMLESLEKMKTAAYRISKVTKALEQLATSESEEYMEGVKMLKID
ncbi:MAG: GAF domain-containing protein [Candidatus Marinimicrobia bacterium]|nr:GAF domain-containing protein [Candidatus Neomarinimicrobiota bacterium]MCH7858172.1 GAF domain-containing protein [Candidatus Neomarinimicrobiota bacterium]